MITVSHRSPDTLGSRVLFIDLTASENDLPGAQDEVLIAKIKEVVLADRSAPASERFDSLKVKPTGKDFELQDKIFRAVDGISPKYVEVCAGIMEQCNLRNLSELEHPWTQLETIKLGGVANGGAQPDDLPKTIFSRIQCLILEYCCSISFTGLTNLKTFRTFENDSIDTFINMCDNNPIAEGLEILDISSPSANDLVHDAEIDDFRTRLKQCSKVRELTLKLNISHDTGHAASFPQSVETLEFCGSTSLRMLRDLDHWIQLAPQSTWLPRLKSICLRFDTALNDPGWHPYSGQASPPVEIAELENKRDVLYQLLRTREPPVSTIN